MAPKSKAAWSYVSIKCKSLFFLSLTTTLWLIIAIEIEGALIPFPAITETRKYCNYKCPWMQVSSSLSSSSHKNIDIHKDESTNKYNYGCKKCNPNINFRKEFQKNGILYKKSILSYSEIQTIKREISKIPRHQLQNEKLNSVARKRVGMSLDNDSEIVRVLNCENGSLYRFINDIATTTATATAASDKKKEERIVMSKDVPVEVRGEIEILFFNC